MEQKVSTIIMNEMTYQPKGSMCAACKNNKLDCSIHDFNIMKIMEKDDNVIIVKCTEFKRVNQ